MAQKKKSATAKARPVADREKAKPKAKSGKPRRKNNLLKLCSEMNRLVIDAVDKEVVKRFKTLIDTSAEEITKASLDAVLKNPGDVEAGSFHESLQPYIKHYIFMVKRNSK
ncbi:MAG: hypothetical protein KBA15_04110 [Spirochaetes bacterium]|jgi:hypothetical protein|nr:hypothetical protein [Spirochaetota bacterium]